ncbi:hypothetical protein KI688_001389 [Linnemannia hyalina]|uniref:YTH domain-containing protein n=1 Tax=Linnemannia hyalina TaxID=64524 RepID=A0A9P7XRU3_9FUNG|nr:hypothetical protein KI688_001389 [Linnemannia hyalina]
MPTTTSTTSSSLSASLSARRSPADQLIAPSTSLPNTVRNNSTTLAQTTTLSNMEASIDSLDLTRPTLRNTTTTTTTSSTSSPVTEPLQTTDPDLATDLQGFTTSTNIKVEPEDPPTLAQAAKASSPEVAVKQEPLSSEDATKFLPQASQPTIPSAPGLVNPMGAEVGAQDPHYIVIRVSDEGDFNDARRSNIWNTNPMYNKALRELYSPTSQVFLIFTVFMSSEFCGIAKMASEMMWVGERTIFDKSNLRQKFKLQWVACSRVSYDSVKEFTHEPIYKIIRKNGCELPQDIGGGIHKLLVENQPEEEPQPTLALQEDDSSALDITATSFSQDMLMGEGANAQESPTLHLNSLFMDTSDMDVDLPEPTTNDFQDKDKDEDQDKDEGDVDSDEESHPENSIHLHLQFLQGAGRLRDVDRLHRLKCDPLEGDHHRHQHHHPGTGPHHHHRFEGIDPLHRPVEDRHVADLHLHHHHITLSHLHTNDRDYQRLLLPATASGLRHRSRNDPRILEIDPRSGPNYQRDRFSNAPTDPRLLVSRNASSSVVPQKRPYDEQSGSMEDDKGTILTDAVDLPASVFPLEDDADDGMGGHFISPTQPINPSATGASSSSSSSAAPGGPSSSTSTTPSTDPPIQITSITLIPSGMSKSRRKKMRKEALAKPLDF